MATTIITKKEIAELAEIHDPTCISIFIPTHRSGQAVLRQKDVLVLKNQLKEVSGKLEHQGLNANEIKQLLKPVENLMADPEFWRHQSDGLAIFLSRGFFRKFTLPVSFEAFNYLSNEFYLKPLMPMFVGDGRFFILALELENVNFYEGTRHTIADVIIHDLTPSKIEEVVGYDHEQKSLQFRTQQALHSQASFHGHGAGKEDRKEEILSYFRAIDKGLMSMLHDESAPMVLACLDHFVPMYREVNTYQQLQNEHISGNPADMDSLLLQERAWELLQPYFNKEREEKLALFQQFRDTARTSSTIDEIVPAALAGKIDTLFLQNRTDIWGIFQPANQEVQIRDSHQPPNVSLTNLAAIQVFLQGGKVYLLEKDQLPVHYSKVNALYRY